MAGEADAANRIPSVWAVTGGVAPASDTKGGVMPGTNRTLSPGANRVVAATGDGGDIGAGVGIAAGAGAGGAAAAAAPVAA